MDFAYTGLPAKRQAQTGFSSEGWKFLKSSSDGPPYSTLGPYLPQYPALVNELLNRDEKAPMFETYEVTGLAHNNVIDVEGEHIKKDVRETPLSVVIINSDHGDDRDKKSDGPFHEIVLPMQEYHASIPYPGQCADVRVENGTNLNSRGKIPRDKGISPEGCNCLKSSSDGPPYATCNRTEPIAPDNSSAVVDYSYLLALGEDLNCFHTGRFGSVTDDIEALAAPKRQISGPYLPQYPALVNELLNRDEKAPIFEIDEVTGLAHNNVIDVEGEHIKKDIHETPLSVVIIDSDDEDDRDKKSDGPFHEIVLPMQVSPSATLKMIEYHASIPYDGQCADAKVENETSLNGRAKSPIDKGVYVGVPEEADDDDAKDDGAEDDGAEDDDAEDDDAEDDGVEDDGTEDDAAKDDGLGDIWRQMSMAIESSKDVSVNPAHDEEKEKEEDCDHSFILKDDLGYVCRVCGLIGKKIETIFEFQYKVKKSTRTYTHDSWNAKQKTDASGIKIGEDDLMVTEIYAHPRHMKQMKPHQVEGFNFLSRNLAGDNPGGCILAHAPGSGKTFMIISFVQSFLGKYPNARPLVVLPKGILSTWKKEFKTWQVEDIPLLDFYSVKADSRFQQLEVLKRWVEQKSILFLGYKQFSSIVCNIGTNRASVDCQDILLKVPSILILDEGHNPRNENTDMVQSLAKVKTPRKVVLSGTLYQNHVKEVFNILNLVRPNFLKMETPRSIAKRIHSRVHIPGVRSFFDLVENTLQKDIDFKTKVAVIQDLREMTSKVLHYYKGDFLDELPGLVDFTVVLKLTPRQKQELERLKRQESRKFKICFIGSALCVHPELRPVVEKCGENAMSDSMMDDMIDKLDIRDGIKSKFFWNILNLCESAGERLLVFSQYLLPLKYLERLVVRWKGWSLGKEIFVISGESSSEHREWSMERFNTSPYSKIFFGSIKACGEGISLVGASRVIILDVHLNPSVTRQAIGRAFRPGQTKKVYVYRFVAADSPEVEDHSACYKKELISKMWFEWNEYCGDQGFEVETVPVKECGDLFLENPLMAEDVEALYRR